MAPSWRETTARCGDLYAVYRPTSKLSIAGCIDVGSQERPGLSAADWMGLGGYLRYAFSDRSAVAVRLERFDDSDNGISGFEQELSEATLTFEHRPDQNLIVKLEGRYDDSTADVFRKDSDELTDNQFLLIAGIVATF